MRLEAWITAAWLVSAATAKNPPRLKGSPEKIKDWKWPNPFNSTRLGKYEATCEVERTFAAEEYVLDDLSVNPPTGLLPYRDALKSVFSSREYPGSWDGIDPHGYDRTLLTMTYADMPLKVREWIEDQERTNGPGKGLFAVYQRPMPGTRVLNTIKVPDAPVPDEWRERDERRIALFAPGALYEMLPLWVAEGSMCEGKSRSIWLTRALSSRFFSLLLDADAAQTPSLTCPGTAPSPPTAASSPTRSTTPGPSGRSTSATSSSGSRPRC